MNPQSPQNSQSAQEPKSPHDQQEPRGSQRGQGQQELRCPHKLQNPEDPQNSQGEVSPHTPQIPQGKASLQGSSGVRGADEQDVTFEVDILLEDSTLANASQSCACADDPAQADPKARMVTPDITVVPLPPDAEEVDDDAPCGYRQVGAAARGGQARVLKVQSLQTGKTLALKCFHSRAAAEREWNILQNHRNDETVPLAYLFGVVDVDRTCGGHAGHYAIVMEFIEGRTLLDLMGDAEFMDKLTVERALRIIAPIARFCANSCQSRSHDVHCDIKPSNIIVQDPASGAGARLIDFGIAASKLHGARGGGTRGYSAPELDPDAFPEARGRVDDHRVDTYSIAATLYALLQGGMPLVGDSGWDEGFLDARLGLPEKYAFDSARLRHDGPLAARVKDHVAAYLADMPKVHALASEQVHDAVEAALAVRDHRLARVLCRCLSHDASVRPMPDQLESELFLDAKHYEEDLFNRAAVECLRVANDGKRPLDLYAAGEEAVSEGTFAEALAAFNCGRYYEAVPVLRLLASKGDVSAMYYLACCIRDGLDCAPDHENMIYLLSRAASDGNILAQNALGQMMYDGDGVPEDKAQGLALIRRSAQDIPGEKIGFLVAKRWLEERGLRP